MKRIFAVPAVLVFVFAGLVFADEGHKMGMMGKKTDMKECNMMKSGKMKGCCELFHMKSVDYKVENTKTGAKIIIAAGDKKAVKEIQKKAKEWIKHRKGMEEMHGKAGTADNAGNKEKVRCPVMGTMMAKKDAYDSIKYKGKTYYFCCKNCPGKFKENPEKYAR